jgi:hypothetical protein
MNWIISYCGVCASKWAELVSDIAAHSHMIWRSLSVLVTFSVYCNVGIRNLILMTLNTIPRGPFHKFVDSPYYSQSELCGGAVTVSYSKYLLGKRCTSYNAPPTSRKRATDRWSLRNFLPRSSLFMFGKDQKSHGARSGLYGGCSNGIPPIHFFQADHRIQFGPRPMPDLEADHSPQCSAKVKNAWNYTSTPPLRLHCMILS